MERATSADTKKKRTFKIKNKLRAIRLWRKYKSLRKTAARLGIYRSTLRRWIQSKELLKKTKDRAFRSHSRKYI